MKASTKSMRKSGAPVYTWGIFLQSDATLIDTAKSRIGCVSKARHLARGSFYIDKFVAP